MKYIYISIVFVLIGSCLGCVPRGPKDAREAAGEYIFGYRKTKEIEVVILKPNFTYQHEFYSNLDSYHTGSTPAYTNSGAWAFDKNELRLYGFSAFCEYGNPDEEIKPPSSNTIFQMSWLAPSGNRDAVLSVSDYYSFIRVTNRSEVKE